MALHARAGRLPPDPGGVYGRAARRAPAGVWRARKAVSGRRQSDRSNIAHAGEPALCAVARGVAVGVDIEQVRPVAGVERLARRCFPLTVPLVRADVSSARACLSIRRIKR